MLVYKDIYAAKNEEGGKRNMEITLLLLSDMILLIP